jgi:acyl dehydratase
MALPGVYTKEEKKMLEMWDAVEQENLMWLGDDVIPGRVEFPVNQRVALKELMILKANAMGDFNPLWRDEKYARQTRWGSIIAMPFYIHDSIAYQGPVSLRVIPPEVGFAKTLDRAVPQLVYPAIWPVFGRWEYFKPIRPGDSFRVWCGPNTHTDITNPDGKGPHTFQVNDQLRFYNLQNQLVAIHHKKVAFSIASQSEAISVKPQPKLEAYKYTKEELDYIDRVRASEIIRGAAIRWWEDVKVGEDLQPVVEGPLTIWGQVKLLAEEAMNSNKGQQLSSSKPHGPNQDPETGVCYPPVEMHLSDKVAQMMNNTQAKVVMGTWMNLLNRLVTNWMGDDAFLKMTEWKMLSAIPLGDTLFGRGKVIRKYIRDDGEHVIDLACWLENTRGYITNHGPATVGLMSRENMIDDLQRY